MRATPDRVVIGLDAGTTSVKAVAFGVGTAWAHRASREYPLHQPAPDHQVQDPGAVLAAAGEALAECVAGTGRAEVVAVAVSAGMHGLVAFDDRQRCLTPLVTWADARARDEARALHRDGRAAALHARTGVPVHPMSPLAKLRWFARHDRATWDRARCWGGLKDLLLHWLTGSLVTELSSASGTGLLDVATGTWSPEALDACGITADRLTPIESPTAALRLAAGTASQVGLPAGTPVVTGAADGPLGNLGTGAIAPGVAGLSLGTSGAVRMAVDEPVVDPRHRLFCYALTETTWVVGGAISNGGSVARWSRQALAPDVAAGADDPDAAALALAAEAPPGCDGLVMLPYLLAERAPLWDPDLPGAYLGLRREHGRAHLLRAAVEGVCLQMRLVLDDLDAVEPVTSVRATGGAFRSGLWREVMAAALGRSLVIGESADGTARGAAALGLVGVGLAPAPADALGLMEDGGPEPAEVVPDPALVAAYDRVRASVPGLLARLGPVADLFAGAPREGAPDEA